MSLSLRRAARPNYDPQGQNTTNSWLLYREMWGSDGEFVITGNLENSEYVDQLATINVPTLIMEAVSSFVNAK